MIRRSLVKTTNINIPDYAVFSELFNENNRMSTRDKLNLFQDGYLRSFIFAYKSNIQEINEPVYNAIRNNMNEFRKEYDEFLTTLPNKSTRVFKRYCGLAQSRIDNIDKVADALLITKKRAYSDIARTSYQIRTSNFVREFVTRYSEADYVFPLIPMDEVVKKLRVFAADPKRNTLKRISDERLRIIFMLFSTCPMNFNHEDYKFFRNIDNARNCANHFIDVFAKDKSDAVKAVLGVNQEAQKLATGSQLYNVNKSTLSRCAVRFIGSTNIGQIRYFERGVINDGV